ncbi:hypothetical protein VNO77_06927 [Canavalia gladiata]|uniref:Uncharacterized protein n=1 Tax=Canavalia gladiata TaxID=3824 RepID=A0AAN9QT57_CANGL
MVPAFVVIALHEHKIHQHFYCLIWQHSTVCLKFLLSSVKGDQRFKIESWSLAFVLIFHSLERRKFEIRRSEIHSSKFQHPKST